MARRKAREQSEETPPADNLVDFPPPEPPASPQGDAYEPPASSAANETFPPPEAEPKKWTSNLPDPFGRHGIRLGADGRTMRFGRSNQFQQVHIFITAPEGVDPRPSKEDTQFLKDHGFRWRGDMQAWSKQLISPDDKADLEAIKAEHGDQEAAKERSKRRGNADADAQAAFVKLANTIRGRSGQEPIDYTVGEQRER